MVPRVRDIVKRVNLWPSHPSLASKGSNHAASELTWYADFAAATADAAEHPWTTPRNRAESNSRLQPG